MARRKGSFRSLFKAFFPPPPPPPPEPEPRPPSPTFSDPWRDINWGNKEENLQYVRDYMPENEDAEHLRILLYGPVGAGKSSFINSVSNTIQGRMTTPALTNAMENCEISFTRKYETHKIRIGRGSDKTYYPFVFNDIMGLEDGSDCGVHADDIRLALKGNVMEGHKFNSTSLLSEGDLGYNTNPSLSDKVHVLVCVISANAAETKQSVLQKMAEIRRAASDLGIPQIGILTKIDEACGETERSLRNVYKSKHLKKKMKDFSSAVGIPMNFILPVKNYSQEIAINDDVDMLILSALKLMIDFGDDFIEKL